jgi:ESAT-6 protein secretion system EspG family protein
MDSRTVLDASLDGAELDLLCTFAGVSAPFPLRIRSAGPSNARRLDSFRAARERLTARRLADQRGPLGVAASFAELLRNCATTLDLVLSIGPDRTGAVLLAHRGSAVLGVRDLDDSAGGVRIVELPVDDAVDELQLLIPTLDAPMTTPFTLPRKALEEIYLALVDRGGDRLDTHELDELLRRHGIDDRLANRMVSLLQPVLGNGQAGLSERGGYAGEWRRVGEELRWLDTERGRFALAGNSEWISVNPLFATDLAGKIRHLAAATSGA